MAPPVNLVLINPKRNSNFNEESRRLISRVAPICIAYNFHLVLVDFGITQTPIEFSNEIAPSTSIGNGGKKLVELSEKGKVKICDLPLPHNIGKKIICTHNPSEKKRINLKKLVDISNEKTIALVFGIEFRKNKHLKKVKKESNIHFDITDKKIKLSLDSEIGAICTSLFNFKKD